MDRIRFPNITSQEMHSIWPYGTFLSPILPTANLPLPYPVTPTISYAAVPLLQAYGAAPSHANQQQGQENANTREPNKMTIQIGVQCVNQNNPININSLNDMVNTMGNINLNFDHGEDEKTKTKEEDCSDRKSICDIASAGSSCDIILNNLNKSKFEELRSLALSGSETAEKLAYAHRNRPCFKKIDSLCARMKQDLIRPDGVLPNINSQGIAWAVKDFIFVFTRVINAWIIIKGYVYNTPEGLNKVKSALSPEFENSFAAWQDTTLDFVDNLIKSFVNLDNLVQSQKNVFQKTTNSNSKTDFSNDVLNSINDNATFKDSMSTKNYMYTMIEDSDATQRQNTLNGTYFKTGTYNFIKRESPDENALGIEHLFSESISKSFSNITSVYDLLSSNGEEKLCSDIRVLENKLSKLSPAFDPNLVKPLGKDLIGKLNVFIGRVMQMKKADLFFKKEFCQNYFPDFISKTPDFMDIRTIILKCQVGGYGHIFEVVHDVRFMINQVKIYLEKNPHPDLSKAIFFYQNEIEKILSEKPFENYQFDHIMGKPNEILYNIGK